MMKLKFKSISFKILLMILSIVLIQGTVLIYFSYSFSKNITYNHFNENGIKTVESYSNVIGNWLKGNINEITIYADTPIVKTMDWAKIQPYLKKEISTKFDIYDHLFVADINGNYSTTLVTNAGNIADRAYFKLAMSGHAVLSDPIISKTTGNQISVIAVPIKNESGEIIGLMCGALNLVKLYNIIEGTGVNDNDSYSYIIDKNGVIIAYPDKEYILKENISVLYSSDDKSLLNASEEILNNDYGYVEYDHNNSKSLSYFSIIPNTDGWRLVTKVPVEYMYKPLNNTNRELILMSLLVALGSILLAFFVSKSISLPIIQLKDVFIKASNGDLTVRADAKSNDEIGQAARSFNKMMQTINDLTYYDSLTALPNRHMFMDRLNHEISDCIKNNQRLAVIIFDIDRFENINNTMGPSTGEGLIKSLGMKIKERLDDKEVVCRLGEDRFAILLSDNPHETNAIRTSLKLLDIANQPWYIDNFTFYSSASLGIAFFPNDGENAEVLLKNAISAMLKAKKSGRNTYQLCDSNTNSKMLDLIELDNYMHNALVNNEFIIHYQPQVDVATSKVVGAEALIRWIHPQLGMISPAKFIPLAEENGLIIPIGEWVLKTACIQNKKWMDAGLGPIYISVNISALQIRRKDFIEMISGILEETQMNPNYLELEITESMAMEDTEAKIKLIETLRNMGIRIAIDDFGTGYSSLSYLHRFQITCLKIDQSFIRGLETNAKNEAIVSTMLDIGRNLNLKVTAEGVETKEQLKFLQNKKCDTIQGFLYSKPVPSEEFENMLKNPPVV